MGARHDDVPIHGDVLEALVSHVPLIDLAPASRVSKEWSRAVFSSLRIFNKLKPWLIVRTQSSRNPQVISTHAYDPRSDAWIEIRASQAVKQLSPPVMLRSSCSSLLYTIAASKFSFSTDLLNVKWREIDGPSIWRKNPVVALVQDKIIVAGGTCMFEEDTLAVEMYNLKTSEWSTCLSLPETFKQSASAAWLSVTVSQHKMCVTEKYSGRTHVYDTNTNNWSGPYDIRSDPLVFLTTIGYINNRPIMVGLIGDGEKVQKVKIYEMTNDLSEQKRVIGEMPEKLVKKMSGAGDDELPMTSIGVSCAGDTVFLYKSSCPEEIVLCEIGEGDILRWRSVRNMTMNDTTKLGRFVFTSHKVEVDDIQRVLESDTYKHGGAFGSFLGVVEMAGADVGAVIREAGIPFSLY